MRIKALKHDSHVQNIKWVCKARGFDDLRTDLQYLYVFTNPITSYVSPMGNGRKVIAATDGARVHGYLVPPDTQAAYPPLDDGVYGAGQRSQQFIELVPLNEPSLESNITAILERRGLERVAHYSFGYEFSSYFSTSEKRIENVSYLIRDLLQKWHFPYAINVSFLIDAYEMASTGVEIEWYDNGMFVMADENHIAAIMPLRG